MIPNESTVLYFKFGQRKWMNKLVSGEISFSCPGNFAFQAKTTGNNVQGDIYDGIFARLKQDDPRIIEMQNKLGHDLEIIIDGEYVILRRRSAKLKPIFCVYSYTAGDVISDGSIKSAGLHSVRHDFDDRLYSGFSNDHSIQNVLSFEKQFAQLTFKPQPFIKHIANALHNKRIKFRRKPVNYDYFAQDTFFIEPTDEYNELFYKFPQYKYQYEERICLLDMKFTDIFKRYTLKICPFPQDSYEMTNVPMYMMVNIITGKKDNTLIH